MALPDLRTLPDEVLTARHKDWDSIEPHFMTSGISFDHKMDLTCSYKLAQSQCTELFRYQGEEAHFDLILQLLFTGSPSCRVLVYVTLPVTFS